MSPRKALHKPSQRGERREEKRNGMKLKIAISRKLCELTRNGGTHPLQKLSSCFCSSSSISSSTISSIPETQSQDHGNESSRSRLSKWLLFLPGASTFGLGTWQILRRQDKIKMLEYRQNRLEMEPLMLNNVSPSNGKLDSLEFRRVRCKGVFDEKRSVYVGPRSRSISGVTENGYYAITPLLPIHNNTKSRQYWLTEDGFLVVGKKSLWKIYNRANFLPVQQPHLSKIAKAALGGGFGLRSPKILRSMPLLSFLQKLLD